MCLQLLLLIFKALAWEEEDTYLLSSILGIDCARLDT